MCNFCSVCHVCSDPMSLTHTVPGNGDAADFIFLTNLVSGANKSLSPSPRGYTVGRAVDHGNANHCLTAVVGHAGTITNLRTAVVLSPNYKRHPRLSHTNGGRRTCRVTYTHRFSLFRGTPKF